MFRTSRELGPDLAVQIIDASGLRDYAAQPDDKHARMEDIEAMAESGCVCCELLVKVYEEVFRAPSVFWTPTEGLQVRRKRAAPDCMLLQFRSAGAYNLDIELFYEPGDVVLWPAIEKKSRRTPIANFTGCKSQITQWLDDCRTYHSHCDSSIITRLPTRVIDVGTTEVPTVRLHEVEGIQYDAYVALSHCWGNAATVPQTREHNLDQHNVFIPVTTLSKTFRDAIEVTRGLGIRYLWIDSLCIIQGCVEDWNREAAKMGQVYGEAYLTLAAVSSADGRGGLFQTSNDPREIRVQPAARPEARCWLRLPFKDELLTCLHSENNLVRQYQLPLLKRKWTFQERLLSRRIIYFAEEELAWECRTSTQCQCNHAEDTDTRSSFAAGVEYKLAPTLKRAFFLAATYTTHRSGVLDLIGSGVKRSQKDPVGALIPLWERMVTQYSLRTLTFHKDSLSALSGVAQACSNLGLGNYYAGIWEKQLPQALCWNQIQHTRQGPLPKRPDQGNAPSWSWAAAQGPVHFPGIDAIYTKVLSIECKPAGNDAFGPVQVGLSELKLQGPAIAASLEENLAEDVGRLRKYRFRIAPLTTRWSSQSFTPDFQLPEGEVDVWLLTVGRGLWSTLVLLPVGNGKYQRIGTCVFEDSSAIQKTFTIV